MDGLTDYGMDDECMDESINEWIDKWIKIYIDDILTKI